MVRLCNRAELSISLCSHFCSRLDTPSVTRSPHVPLDLVTSSFVVSLLLGVLVLTPVYPPFVRGTQTLLIKEE